MNARTLFVFSGLMVAAFSSGLAACSDDTASTADAASGDVSSDASGDAGDIQEDTGSGAVLANVYAVSPVDTPETVQVELLHLTAEDGVLLGDFARVRGCIRDLDAVDSIALPLGPITLNITTCLPRHVATAGDDGTFLHIDAPATPADDDGQFAEVMMYHHVNVIHDYFKSVHGLTNRDEPLDAIVNLQAHVDLCDQWSRLPNAAFFPQEGLDQLPFNLDLDLNGDAIVFSGTESKNFAFDATVIYHEYTHAIVGATRLSGVFPDSRGLNNLPGALNESYADYFATTLIGAPALGNYSLNGLEPMTICNFQLGGSGDAGRNMVNDFQCPNDLTAEVHADAEIFSAALWKIRTEFGAVDADAVILAGAVSLTNESGFTAAAEATIDAAAELLDAAAADFVEATFNAHGLLNCSRVMPIDKIGARGLPVSTLGTDAFSLNPYGDYAPGYMQFQVDIPEGTTVVTLSFDVAEGGGFGGFGGGGGPAMAYSVALKPGDAPVNYVSLGPSIDHDAVAVLPVDAEASALALAGDCLAAGPLTFAVHNRGGGMNIQGISATFSQDAPPTTNFDGCGQ